ncbi:hypothetical protein B841_02435 [Corynebacterium maris DSM 45190]|uniref:Uncharacterized protein n=1 Tax=Corynebacterium maris DSM 45190 TaxID=1224163 RepID=S5T0B6_9CORY|nr:hypothetical protein [Corynebacterium maris]AGS33970.1 hypothetical protein B841_02435 [Corynebacterium maris DSM 45190]
MAIVTLRENQTTTIPAEGMLHVEASPAPGYSQHVALTLEGEATIRPVSPSASRLVRGTGRIRIIVSPRDGDEFGPGTTIHVNVTRGRPGTPQVTGAEFVGITLDGRSETVIGTLHYEDDTLVIESAVGSTQADQPFEGVAASVRAGLRALINRHNIDTSILETAPTPIAVDSSVSMKAQTTEEDLDLAVKLFIGAVGALKPETSFSVRDDRLGRPLEMSTREELIQHVVTAVRSEGNHIGAGAHREPGSPENPTFSISDEEPYGHQPYGLSIVIGDTVRDGLLGATDTPGVLRVTSELRATMEEGSDASKNAIYEHILNSCITAPAEGGPR